MRYVVEWSHQALSELERLRSYDVPPVAAATAALRDQATTQTRNRKPLFDLPFPHPNPTWELRVRSFRVLYAVEGEKVVILRVILKGRRTTLEAL